MLSPRPPLAPNPIHLTLTPTLALALTLAFTATIRHQGYDRPVQRQHEQRDASRVLKREGEARVGGWASGPTRMPKVMFANPAAGAGGGSTPCAHAVPQRV